MNIRPIKFGLVCSLIFLSLTPAIAFDSRGKINSHLNYKDLLVQEYGNRIKLTGTIENKSDKTLRISGALFFVDTFDQEINSADINIIVQVWAKKNFETYLNRRNNFRETKHAQHLVWKLKAN